MGALRPVKEPMALPADALPPPTDPRPPLPPPASSAPRPTSDRSLSARLREIADRRPPEPPGKGIVLATLGVVLLAGLVWTFTKGGPVKAHMDAERARAERQAEQERQLAEAAAARPTPSLPGPASAQAPPSGTAPVPPAPAPAPAGAPGVAPPAAPTAPPPAPAVPGEAAPEMTADGGLVVGHVSELVDRALGAPPEQRARLRQAYLGFFAATVSDPRWRRTILIEAARLAPDTVPEEAAALALVTEEATGPALEAPGDAAAAVLFLGSLRDRGGPKGLAALERLVLAPARGVELRVLAAHALPAAARVRAAQALGSQAHPALLAALR